MKRYLCLICGLIYDESEGWPDDGIDPGTKWEDVPDTWVCPDCGATKDDFDMIELNNIDNKVLRIAPFNIIQYNPW